MVLKSLAYAYVCGGAACDYAANLGNITRRLCSKVLGKQIPAEPEVWSWQAETHRARSAELDQLRRDLAEAQAVAAAAARPSGVPAGLPVTLPSLRSTSGVTADSGGPSSTQGSMPVTPTASWTQVCKYAILRIIV